MMESKVSYFLEVFNVEEVVQKNLDLILIIAGPLKMLDFLKY